MISLAKSGSTVTFTFDDNSTYLQNGTIEVPLNSLSLVIDESNMVTFKKSASNDIFVSANIAEFGMSKSDLESWYKNNMVGSTGGGTDTGTVQTMIDESISGKADSVSAVSSAEYDSSATTINFKNIDGDIISSIDASDFVIDGMIDNVSIETISGESYLVIDFNTASGKEDIQIPISDIFDADNYYTKAEVDAIASGKVDTSAYTPVTVSSAITEGDTNAVAGGAVYDKTTVIPIPSSGIVLTFTDYGTSTNLPKHSNRIDANFSLISTASSYSIKFVNKSGQYIQNMGVNFMWMPPLSSFMSLSYTGCTATTSGAIITVTYDNDSVCEVNVPSGVYATAYGDKEIWLNDALIEHTSNNSIHMTSGDVQSMIDESISGKAETSAVTSVNDALTAHTADTTIHVTTAQTASWDAKSNFSGSYNDLTDKPTIPTVPTSNTAFTNDAGYITSDALSGYAESSAVTVEINAATSGKVDTSSVVSSVTSASTDNEIPTAKAVFDAIGQGGGGVDSGTVQAMIDEAISGKVDTSSVVSSVTSASTDSEIPTAKAVFDAIPTGGSASYSAGTNISIANDTISCTLPIVVGGNFNNCLDLTYGGGNENRGSRNVTLGAYTKTTNNGELAIGRYNVSNTSTVSPTYNNPNKTVFSVGNGTADNGRHNAFEIRQNGDMYLNNGTSDVKLQDYLQIKVVKLTQSAYDALSPNYDSNTLYIIKD